MKPLLKNINANFNKDAGAEEGKLKFEYLQKNYLNFNG